LQKYVKNKEGFTLLTNWKKWSAIKKAAVAATKKQTRKEVKSLVSWQHHRKQLTTGSTGSWLQQKAELRAS